MVDPIDSTPSSAAPRLADARPESIVLRHDGRDHALATLTFDALGALVEAWPRGGIELVRPFTAPLPWRPRSALHHCVATLSALWARQAEALRSSMTKTSAKQLKTALSNVGDGRHPFRGMARGLDRYLDADEEPTSYAALHADFGRYWSDMRTIRTWVEGRLKPWAHTPFNARKRPQSAVHVAMLDSLCWAAAYVGKPHPTATIMSTLDQVAKAHLAAEMIASPPTLSHGYPHIETVFEEVFGHGSAPAIGFEGEHGAFLCHLIASQLAEEVG